MSRFGVEKACFDLREPSNEALFRDRRDEFLARYPLSTDERSAIARGDVGALLTRDVCYGALGELMRVFRYDVETYVTRLRASAGLPASQPQLDVLRARSAGRKRAG